MLLSVVIAAESEDEQGSDSAGAFGFAVVLYKIVRSPAVSSALSSIVNHALHAI